MKTLIYDNDQCIVEGIRKIFHQLDIDVTLDIGDMKDVQYDLCFIDSRYLDLADTLRQNNPECIIIVLGENYDCVLHSFELKAFQYLLKPINEDLLLKEIVRAINEYRENNKYRMYKIDFEMVLFNLDEIIYLESYYNQGMIQTVNQSYHTSYKNIRIIKEDLIDYDFINVHSGYFVNMNYIKKIDRKNIELTNGGTMPVSTIRHKEIRDKIIEFRNR